MSDITIILDPKDNYLESIMIDGAIMGGIEDYNVEGNSCYGPILTLEQSVLDRGFYLRSSREYIIDSLIIKKKES